MGVSSDPSSTSAQGAVRSLVHTLRTLSPRARRLSLAFAVLGIVAMTVPFLLVPVVGRAVKSRSSALGLEVTIGGIGPVFGVVRLRDVVIVAHQVPAVRLTLSRVDIHPTLGPRLFRVEAHGGDLAIDGSLADVRDQLDALRFRPGRRSAPEEPGRATIPVRIDGLRATWAHAFRGSDAQRAWGLALERRGDGTARIGVDLARGEARRQRVEAVNLAVDLGRAGSAFTLAGASAERITMLLDLDPPSEQASVPSSPPKQQGPRQTAADRWRHRLRRVAEILAKVVPPGRKVEMPGALHVQLHHAGQTLNVGPATAFTAREKDHVRFGIASGAAPHATPIGIEVSLPLVPGPSDIHFSGGPVSLAALGVNEGDMGLLDVGRSEVQVEGHAQLAENGAAARVTGSSRWTSLSIKHPKLAADPVRGLDLGASGSAEIATDGSRVAFSDIDVTVGRVHLRAAGQVERSEGHSRGSIHAEVPLTACMDAVAAIPAALAPFFPALKVEGSFAISGDLAFDTRRLSDTRVTWEGENGCRLREVPAALDPARFRAPWSRTVLDADGSAKTIESGPGSASWVPFSEISPFVPTAVLVCEDSRFFSHHGFDAKSISDSIRDNLRAGRFVRGGSTVTQQLAKNLFLGREKTLSRKLQEAALTLLLEQSFTKEELLELYLNVVELGPGLYGIGPATDRYFGSSAKQLSLGQAFYLISLLPNPKYHHLGPDGAVSPAWSSYLKTLMAIAKKIGRIDDRELEAGLAEQVRVRVGDTREEGAGPGEGSSGDDTEVPPWAEGAEQGEPERR